MTKADYKNYAHYVEAEWKNNPPKDMFKAIIAEMKNCAIKPDTHILDIGCATGEFLYHIGQSFPKATLTGADIFDDLLTRAREHQPAINFTKASVLELPQSMENTFDVTLAIGVMSIFDETQIETFWDNLLKVTKTGGYIFVLSPLNEFGVDAMIRHRKRTNGFTGSWESGWNIFARDTIAEILATRGQTLNTQPFNISFDLKPQADAIRTWTMDTQNKQRQLTNGLKLLVDHQIMIVEKK